MVESLCRLCFKQGVNLLNIFDNAVDSDINSDIQFCIGISINVDDAITTFICRSCFYMVKAFSELRSCALENDLLLKNDLEKKKKISIISHKYKAEANVSAENDLVSHPEQVPIIQNNDKGDSEIKGRVYPICSEVDKLNSANLIEHMNNFELQKEFMNQLNLTSNTAERKAPMKRCRLRYHPSVSKIKIAYTSVNVPKQCWKWHFDPKVVVNKKIVEDWLLQNNQFTATSGSLIDQNLNENLTKSSSEDLNNLLNEFNTRMLEGEGVISDSNTDKSFIPSTTSYSTDDFFTDLEDKTKNNKRKRKIKTKGRGSSAKIPKENEIPITNKEESEEENLKKRLLSETESDSLQLLVETSQVSETFICQTCDAIYDTLETLNDHKRHHQSTSLRCQQCLKSFAIGEELVKHTLEAHENIHANENTDQSIMTNSNINVVDKKKNIAKKSTSKNRCVQPADTDAFPKDIVIDKDDIGSKSNSSSLNIQEELYIISSDEEIENVDINKSNTNSNDQNETSRLRSLLENNNSHLNVTNKTHIMETVIKPPPKTIIMNQCSQLTSLAEQIYLKTVFRKCRQKKVTKKGVDSVQYSNKMGKVTNGMVELKEMEKLLERTFIPIETVPRFGNMDLTLRYKTNLNSQHINPKDTYKWCNSNAIDIPKKEMTGLVLHPPSTATSRNNATKNSNTDNNKNIANIGNNKNFSNTDNNKNKASNNNTTSNSNTISNIVSSIPSTKVSEDKSTHLSEIKQTKSNISLMQANQNIEYADRHHILDNMLKTDNYQLKSIPENSKLSLDVMSTPTLTKTVGIQNNMNILTAGTSKTYGHKTYKPNIISKNVVSNVSNAMKVLNGGQNKVKSAKNLKIVAASSSQNLQVNLKTYSNRKLSVPTVNSIQQNNLQLHSLPASNIISTFVPLTSVNSAQNPNLHPRTVISLPSSNDCSNRLVAGQTVPAVRTYDLNTNLNQSNILFVRNDKQPDNNVQNYISILPSNTLPTSTMTSQQLPQMVPKTTFSAPVGNIYPGMLHETGLDVNNLNIPSGESFLPTQRLRIKSMAELIASTTPQVLNVKDGNKLTNLYAERVSNYVNIYPSGQNAHNAMDEYLQI